MSTVYTPRIYIACLAAYNNGRLHGSWVDANKTPEDLYEEINKILASSPEKDAEEWAIHGQDGFGDFILSESTSMEKISELAEFIEEHGDLGAELLGHTDGDVEEAQELLENNYHGEHESISDFARYLTEETTTIPSNLAFYIDYEFMAKDLFISDFFYVEVDSKIHVFSH